MLFRRHALEYLHQLPACLAILIFIQCLLGCSLVRSTNYLSSPNDFEGILTEQTLELNSSIPPLDVRGGTILAENSAAFETKVSLIKNARRSIDILNPFFPMDYTSSFIAKELIAAANRGVRVRLMLDFYANQKSQIFYSMLEKTAEAGGGRLQVKFFRAPPANPASDEEYPALRLKHRFLLIDEQYLIVGGRDFDDSCHSGSSKLPASKRAAASDLLIEFRTTAWPLTRSFEQFWTHPLFAATLAELIRNNNESTQISQSEELMHQQARTYQEKYSTQNVYEEHRSSAADCAPSPIALTAEPPPAPTNTKKGRRRKAIAAFKPEAASYMRRFRQCRKVPQRQYPAYSLDPGAKLFYLENLPAQRTADKTRLKHILRPSNGKEEESGKYVHNTLLAAFRNTCRLASASQPRQIVILAPHFFPSSNVLSLLAQMQNGEIPCAHVNITIITNAPQPKINDFSAIAGRYQLSALFSYLAKNRQQNRGATLRYFEYSPASEEQQIFIAGTVMLFGPDIFIGSTDANVRAYMLETSNGVFIRNSPQLHAKYLDWTEHLLEDALSVTEQTALISQGSFYELLKHDADLIGYPANYKEAAGETAAEHDDRASLLHKVYRLSLKVAQGGLWHKSAEQEFDEAFEGM